MVKKMCKVSGTKISTLYEGKEEIDLEMKLHLLSVLSSLFVVLMTVQCGDLRRRKEKHLKITEMNMLCWLTYERKGGVRTSKHMLGRYR